MLKRFAGTAVVGAMVLSLVACGGTVPSGSIVQDGSLSSTQNEEVSTAGDKQQEKDELRAYLQSEIVVYPTRMWDMLGQMLDALETRDSSTIKTLRDSVQEMTNEVITYNDVPSVASDYHDILSDISIEILNASNYLHLASFGTSDAGDHINTASESIEDVGGLFEQLNEELDSLTSEYGITEIGNPYISSDSGTEASASEEQAGPATSVSEGKYLAGADIVPGEYKLTADPGETAYADVTDSSGADANILVQDIFENSSYITVSEGQYLTLMRCTAELYQ